MIIPEAQTVRVFYGYIEGPQPHVWWQFTGLKEDGVYHSEDGITIAKLDGNFYAGGPDSMPDRYPEVPHVGYIPGIIEVDGL